MKFKSSAELKRLARGQLIGKYGISITALMIFASVMFCIEIPIVIIFEITFLNSAAYLLYVYLIVLIVTLLLSVLYIGYAKFFLNVSRNKDYCLKDILWGVTHHPDKIIIITFLLMVISYACMAPALLYYYIFYKTYSLPAVLIAILLYVAAYVVIIMITLRYSLVFFILVDNPEKSPLWALRESRLMMVGHKGRLFYIYLSFLGYALLGLLSYYIAFLWIAPYMAVTFSYFYMDLKGELSEPIHESSSDTSLTNNYTTNNLSNMQ